MNNLTVQNINGRLYVDSREVAKMVDKRHADVLRKIKGYEKILTNAKMMSLDFFIKDNYLDIKGEKRPCYLLTKKGCDMLVNKMTGDKGILFTAEYVAKFEQMEREIQLHQTESSLSTSYIEALRQLAEIEEKKVANRHSKQCL